MLRRIFVASAGVLLVALAGADPALAFDGCRMLFATQYPNFTGFPPTPCQLCHVNPQGFEPWNAYGWSLRQLGTANASGTPCTAPKFTDVESLDADAVGGTNIQEITLNTQPGWCDPATQGCVNLAYFKDGHTSAATPPAGVALDPVVDTVAPFAPTGLAATLASATQISLSWTAPTDNVGVTGYQVDRCTGATCSNFLQIATPSTASYNDPGRDSATTYRYRVRATDAAHNVSDNSNIATATTPDTTPPTSPSGLAATLASATQINLTWTGSTDNVGVTNYLIERCQGTGCSNFQQVTTSTTLGAADINLLSGTSYSYRVRATDAAANLSGYSNTASAVTPDTTPPTSPSVISATVVSASEIDISWTASTDNIAVTGYLLERCLGASCTNFAQIATPTTQGYNDLGVAGATTYRYRVRAIDAAGNFGDYSSIVNGTTPDATAPSAPGTLGATASGSSQINLAWGPATDNVAVTSYLVERCLSASCTFAQITTTTSATTTFNDTGLSANTGYSYRVRATDAAGNLGAYSNIAAATTTQSADTTAPSAPGTLGATASGSSQINLAWIAATDNVGVTAYLVERCLSASCTFAQITTTTVATTTFNDTGLSANTGYSYRVRATDAAGNLGAYSNIAAATTTQSADITAPSAPSTLGATAASGTQINLAWIAATDNVGVTGYLVERCLSASCTFAQITTTTATSFNDTGLTANTGYSYRVRATDAAGNLGGYSNTASATTQAVDTTAPSVPGGVTATAVSSAQINLAWGASTDNVGVAGYQVDRCQGASCTSFAQIPALPTGTSLSDSGLAASTSYSYRVRAFDAAGNVSANSSTVSATTLASGGPAGLVGGYAFSETSGTTTADASGNNNTGTLVGATRTTAGKYGNAVVFGGSDSSYVDIGNGTSLQLTGSMTVSAWINSTAYPGDDAPIVSKRDATGGFQLDTTVDGGPRTIGFKLTNPSTGATMKRLGATTLQLNQWYFVTGVYDAAAQTISVYLNGVLDNGALVGTVAATQQGSGMNVNIGRRPSESGYDFTGTIDEVRIYNRALTQAEIQGDMAASVGSGGTPPPPDTTSPSAPATLTATASGANQINLSWVAASDNVGVTGYLVERCQGTGCTTFAQIAAPTATTFSDSGLGTNTNYSYRVRATDAAGNLGPYSAVASATTSASSAPAGLVAGYAFSEASGTTTADASGNNNTGTLNGVTHTTAGKYGNALVFSGSDSSYVDLGNPTTLQLTGSMTVSAWINSSAYPGDDAAIVSKRDSTGGYQLDTTVDGGPRTVGFKLTNPSTGATMKRLGATTLQLNQWYFVTGVYDAQAQTINVYLNGVLDNGALTGPVSATQQASTLNVNIGRRPVAGGYVFTGTIDEVRIYGRALSQAEIQADMAAPVGSGGGTPPQDTTAPTAPSVISATVVSASEIDVSWTASSDNVGVTGYQIDRCQGASCTNFARIATSSTPSYNNLGLAASTVYRYRVRAFDAAGNVSVDSSVVNATTQAASDTTPPGAPSSLTATAASGTQINLAWIAATDNVGVTGYLVERCLSVSCTFAQIATTSATSFSDTGLSTSTNYSYRVRATDAAGNLGNYSNFASATTQAADISAPSAPTSLTATAVGATQINLAWTAATDNVGVTGYLVERCQGTGCTTFAQIATPTATSFSDTGLAASTGYSYRVRATDAAGNLGPYSTTASATTLASALVAGYAFSEASGNTTADSSGNNNTGTLIGATRTTAGKFGNALVFSGSDSSYVDLGTSPSLELTGSTTISAWINSSAYPGDDAAIVSKRDSTGGYQLDTTVDGGPRTVGFKLTNSSTGATMKRLGATALQLNQWYFVTGVYDAQAQTINVYLNGVLDNGALTGPVSATQQLSGTTVNIGRRSGASGYAFTGTIDEVRIYGRALSQAEIQADMGVSAGNVMLSTTSITFPDQLIGAPGAPRTLTLTNTRSSAVAIGSVAISGPQASEFGQANDCGSSLAPGASCTLSVVFTAGNTGTRTATLVVSDNAPGSPRTVALTGTGVSFIPLAVSPRAVALTVGQALQLTTNSGGASWAVDGVAGGSAASGTITATGTYTAPGATGVHTVTATTASQTVSATVYVVNTPGVFTHHNDNFRTGQNLNETVLTQANVTAAKFGKLFSYALDGIAYASPLYVANVTIPSKGVHNVVYVATEHNTVYAFDADGLSSTPLWQVNVGTSVLTGDVDPDADIGPEIGITSTPVIDPASGTLYVAAKAREAGNFVHRLHALDIATGAEKFGGPVLMTATVPGTGMGSAGGQLSFNGQHQNQRSALLLSNGVVYVAFAAHSDVQPYHGWIFGYNASSLQRTLAFNTSPNDDGAGIWHSGGGPAADAAGNIYFSTGNSTANMNPGANRYAESFVKLSPAGTVLSFFTPHDVFNQDGADLDLASAGVMLLPDQPGVHPRLLIGAGKSATIYLVDRDNLGGFNPNNDSNAVQTLPGIFGRAPQPNPGNYSNPVYFNGSVYFGPVADTIQAFRLTNGQLPNAATSHSSETYAYPGAALAISANGTSDGILWAIQGMGQFSSAPGVLRAYDAANLANEIYSSDQSGSRDTMDIPTKFSIPIIVNGKVFVGSKGRLTVYGLLP